MHILREMLGIMLFVTDNTFCLFYIVWLWVVWFKESLIYQIIFIYRWMMLPLNHYNIELCLSFILWTWSNELQCFRMYYFLYFSFSLFYKYNLANASYIKFIFCLWWSDNISAIKSWKMLYIFSYLENIIIFKE